MLSDAPLRLTDVVRAAVGRVEGYQRVVLSAEGDAIGRARRGRRPDADASPNCVENAVSFSPQHRVRRDDPCVRPPQGA